MWGARAGVDVVEPMGLCGSLNSFTSKMRNDGKNSEQEAKWCPVAWGTNAEAETGECGTHRR